MKQHAGQSAVAAVSIGGAAGDAGGG